MNEYGTVGAGRTVLPPGKFALYAATPIILSYTLAAIPTHILGTRIKQILSIPLMAALIAVPYLYRNPDDDLFCIFCQAMPISIFQRLTDVFWDHPVLYKKDAYLSTTDLMKESLSCVRVEEQSVKTKEKETDAATASKRKGAYHLLLPITVNLAVYDLCATYISTFTAQDVLYSQKHNLPQQFIFFLAGISLITSTLNTSGHFIQLVYAIFVGHGYYNPDEWRLMMNYPLMSTSLEEVWSHRWHRIFRPAWVSSAFKPVYFLIREMNRKSKINKYIALGMANLAVFVASGITHEYIVLCNAGWTAYYQRYMGQEMIFFVLHGLLVVMEKTMKSFLRPMVSDVVSKSLVVRLAKQFYVIYIAFITFPWFINSFAPWGLYKLESFTPIGPMFRDYLMATPYLRQLCGSLL